MGLAATNVRNKLLAWFQGTANPFGTPPTRFYVALLTTTPSDEDGTGLVEVSASGWTNYARQAVDAAISGTGWSAITGTNPASISNQGAVDYGTATTTGSIVVVGFALYDAASVGAYLGWGSLTGGSQVITGGRPVAFPAGTLAVAI